MHMFKPIQQNRKSEEVIAQLKEAIFKGRFKAGDKLPSERELKVEFGVSRGGIREAIRSLEQSGFLVTRQGTSGGAFVTELSFQHVANAFFDLFLANKLSIPELTQVRCCIEPEMARLAALNISTRHAEALEGAEQAEYLPHRSNFERFQKLTKVHLTLAQICGNHFFEAILRSLLKLTGEIVLAVDPDHKTLHGAGEHRMIVDAVLSGDGDAAFSCMRQHLNAFAEKIIKMEQAYRKKLSFP